MPGDANIETVVDEINRRIKEGFYKPGQRLPSERELATTMNVSRQTMRTALRRLQAENAIYTIPRSGFFIQGERTVYVIGPGVPPLIRQKEKSELGDAPQEKEIRLALRSFEQMFARGEIAEKMRIVEQVSLMNKRDQVLREYCIYSINNIPYRIIDSYYSLYFLEKFPEYDDQPIQWLQKYREKITSAPEAFEKITCRMPDAEEAYLLNINRNQPVVDIERWIIVRGDELFLLPEDHGEKVFAYTHIVANAALHAFTYTYNQANWDDLTNKLRGDSQTYHWR